MNIHLYIDVVYIPLYIFCTYLYIYIMIRVCIPRYIPGAVTRMCGASARCDNIYVHRAYILWILGGEPYCLPITVVYWYIYYIIYKFVISNLPAWRILYRRDEENWKVETRLISNCNALYNRYTTVYISIL